MKSGERVELRITTLSYIASPLAVTPDGDQIWADSLDACSSGGYDHAGCPPGTSSLIHIIDTRTRAVVKQIPEGGQVMMLPDNSGVGVFRSPSILVFDRKFRLIGSIPVGVANSVLFSTDGRRIYVLSEQGVSIIDIIPSTHP